MAKIPTAINLGPRQTPRASQGVPNLRSIGAGVQQAADIQAQTAQNEGRGLMALGQGLASAAESLDDINQRVNMRRESIERIRADREYKKFTMETLSDFQTSRDFSKKEDLDEFEQMLDNQMNDIIQKTSMSKSGKLRLMERLTGTMSSAMGQAFTSGVQAQDALVDAEFKEIINTSVNLVRSGADPETVIKNAIDEMNKEADSLTPAQELGFIADVRAKAHGAKLKELLSSAPISANLDEAEEYLVRPEVAAALGPNMTNAVRDQINKIRAEGHVRVLPKAEVLAMGFPEGTVVQRNKSGFRVLFTPPKDMGTRAEKIKSNFDQIMRINPEGDETVALERATNIVDGNIYWDINETTGRATEVNKINGTVKEVKIQPNFPTPQAAVPLRTLYFMAAAAPMTGLGAGASEFFSETVGQLPFVPIDETLINIRQQFAASENDLIRALTINAKNPVMEQERIRKQIGIQPKIWRSQRSLLARMQGLDTWLRNRLQNEMRVRDDPNQPEQARSDAATKITALENFISSLGVPQPGEPQPLLPPDDVPDWSIPLGVFRKPGDPDDGKIIWQTPDGKRVLSDEG